MSEPLINIPPIKTKPPPPTTAATTTTTTTLSSSSPRVTVSTPTTTTTTTSSTPFSTASRKIAIAVDLSEESAFAVKWAVNQYLRPGDAVFLVHIRPTSVLYGADWGCVDVDGGGGGDREKLEEEFDAFTESKAADLAKPLIDAQVPYKIHIVKDHDLKERLCLEVERLGFNAVIMGSRGFGASKKRSNDRLGSVSDYCVRHCVCPVVVVRYPDEKDGNVDDVMVSADKEGVALKEEKSREAVGKRKDTA